MAQGTAHGGKGKATGVPENRVAHKLGQHTSWEGVIALCLLLNRSAYARRLDGTQVGVPMPEDWMAHKLAQGNEYSE
jgi:hypothetical protein